jgi:hypothetical protein
MSEEQNTEMSEQEQFDALLKQLQQSIDPRDFMTPTQREIAYMTTEELEEAYQQVQARESNRGRMQRELIVSRYEYEQQKQQENENNEDNV